MSERVCGNDRVELVVGGESGKFGILEDVERDDREIQMVLDISNLISLSTNNLPKKLFPPCVNPSFPARLAVFCLSGLAHERPFKFSFNAYLSFIFAPAVVVLFIASSAGTPFAHEQNRHRMNERFFFLSQLTMR